MKHSRVLPKEYFFLSFFVQWPFLTFSGQGMVSTFFHIGWHCSTFCLIFCFFENFAIFSPRTIHKGNKALWIIKPTLTATWSSNSELMIIINQPIVWNFFAIATMVMLMIFKNCCFFKAVPSCLWHKVLRILSRGHKEAIQGLLS